MTDGVIVNKGWLEQGGYRLGIVAPGGAYFYYAHLDSYAELEEGDVVQAGDILGYMGDSGYGEEGTKGKFPGTFARRYLYLSGRKGNQCQSLPCFLPALSGNAQDEM